MEQERFDRTYYIRSVQRRVRIMSVVDDPWSYDLATVLSTAKQPGDIELDNQNDFDAVLAGLRLIRLGWGRRFVNMLVEPLEILARWYDQPNMPGLVPIQRMRRLDAPRE